MDPTNVNITLTAEDQASKPVGSFVDLLGKLVDQYGKVVTAGDESATSMEEQSKAAEALVANIRDLIASYKELNTEEDAATVSNDATYDSIKRSTKATQQYFALLQQSIPVLSEEIARLDELTASQNVNIASLQEQIAAFKEQAAAAKASSAALEENQGFLDSLASKGSPAIFKTATWAAFGIGGVAYESVKQFSALNSELTQSITQAGRAAGSLPTLMNMTLSVAQQTGVGFSDVANMIYRVSSATAGMNNGLGATNAQLAAMVKQTANFAVLGNIASGAPMEQASRVMGAIMNADLSDTGMNAAKIAAVMNAGVGAGDIKPAEMISALGRGALSVAKAEGVSAQSLLSFIDLLTTKGTPGSTAGQYARTALTMMGSPSAQGAKALAMIGITPGTLNQLMAGPGGITAVAQYLHDALQQFNPSAFNIKYKGATGAAGATALLENWGVGDIPQAVINAWASGQLGSMGSATAGFEGKSGQTWLDTLSNLIVTKAFGGSKSSATIDALVNNPAAIAGIYEYIGKHSSIAEYNKDVARAQATPKVQFARMKQEIMADFVEIGQTITPWFLKLGKILVDVVGALTKFKPVLEALMGPLLGIIGYAMVIKAADTAKNFKNFLSKGLGGGVKGEAVEQRQTGLLEEIAANTRTTAAATETGDLEGRGGLGGGGGRSSLFNKLFKRGESSAASDVEGAVVSDAEKVGVGAIERTGITAGLGEIAGSALGFLGGPVGMLAMTMAAPLVMPLVGKAVSGIVSGLSSLFHSGKSGTSTAFKPNVPTNPTDPNSILGQILNTQASLSSLSAKIANGTATNADYASYKALTDKLRYLQNIKSSNARTWATDVGSGNKAIIAQKTAEAKNNAFTASALAWAVKTGTVKNGDFYSIKQVPGYKSLSSAEQKQLENTILSTGSIQAVQATLAAYQKSDWGFLNNAAIDPSFYNHMLANKTFAGQSAAESRARYLLGTHYNQNLAPGQASARFATFTRAAMSASAQSQVDAQLAASGKLGAGASAALKEAATKLKEQAQAYEKAAENVAQRGHFSAADQNALRTAVAEGLKTANSELGLTQTGMAQAFASALGSGGLSTLITNINKKLASGKGL